VSKAFSIILRALLLVAVAMCSGCERRNAKAARASRSLAQTIARGSLPETNGRTAVNRIEEERVYLDASASMSGFVNPRSHSTFDDFIDEIGNALPGCQLYRYGQSSEAPPRNVSELTSRAGFSLELHRPSFYNLRYNPDDRLIDDLATEDKAVLSVLITDGVYSEVGGGTPPPVVGAIQKWMERGRAFGILVLRSRFSGPFYSERARRMMPAFSVEARPFYAFVFSPTEQAFRGLQEKLQQRFPDLRTVLFSDNAVTCTLIAPERVKGLYSHAKPPEAPYYWSMFDSRLFEQKDPTWLDYGIKYQPAPDYSATEFKGNIEPLYYRWIGGHFEKTTEPAAFRCEIKTPDGNQKAESSPSSTPPDFVIHTLFPRDSTCDFSFYHLNLSTSFRSLRPDIRDLSTRDDSIRVNANKTFRFFELVNALTDVHFKTRLAPKISPALFVTVANN